MLTNNPETVPRIKLTMANSSHQLVYIKAVYHQMMDKPERHCESSESYSLTACIKSSISRIIVCRLKWDAWRVDQLPKFEEEYEQIDTWEQTWTLIELTVRKLKSPEENGRNHLDNGLFCIRMWGSIGAFPWILIHDGLGCTFFCFILHQF